MDTSSISGTSLLMRAGLAQQALSVTMMRQAADQQNKMANMLDINTRQPSQKAVMSGTDFNFSTYA